MNDIEFTLRDDFKYSLDDDAIGIFDNVFPDKFCKKIIDNFDLLQKLEFTNNRQKSENCLKLHKNDDAVELNNILHNDIIHTIDMRYADYFKFNGQFLNMLFIKGVRECFDIYAEKWNGLKLINHHLYHMKVQKTTSGGGYHIWHHEHGPGMFATRDAVYMLYLNTLPPEANGETEFLHQQRRVNPVENRLVIWPAGYTHLHRGNAVFGDQAKYVVTGWFHVDQDE